MPGDINVSRFQGYAVGPHVVETVLVSKLHSIESRARGRKNQTNPRTGMHYEGMPTPKKATAYASPVEKKETRTDTSEDQIQHIVTCRDVT